MAASSNKKSPFRIKNKPETGVMLQWAMGSLSGKNTGRSA